MKFFGAAVFSLILFASLDPPPVHAAKPGDIVINEIAWMGSLPKDGESTQQAANNEWLELYNTGNEAISVDGWLVRSRDNNPSIQLSGSIAAGSYFLLSRANETVASTTADLVYPYDTKRSALGNAGEHLELLDGVGNIIDDAGLWNMDWFAGNNDTKQTMERNAPQLPGSDHASWADSRSPGGTPKARNSVYEPLIAMDSGLINADTSTENVSINQSETPPAGQEHKSADTSDNSATTTQSLNETTQAPLYPLNIFVNELMPYPIGPDELEEWIELINESNEAASISSWKVKDMLGAINVYTFPEGSNVAAHGFLVLSRPTTKITMNNDNDGVQLIRPDGELIQTVPYGKAPKGKSYARYSGTWEWSAIPTPGSANIVPVSPSERDEHAPPKQTGALEDVKKVIKEYNASTTAAPTQTASISESSFVTISSPLTVFLAALIALFSAIFIFLLKKRLRS